MAEEEPKEEMPPGFTPEELSRINALETKRLAKEPEQRRLEVEIYDDYVTTVAASGRQITVPKPTLGTLQLYDARRSYFEGSPEGLGRLLWVLRHQYEKDVIRGLRSGLPVPEEEAAAILNEILPEDMADYYITFWTAARQGEETSKKKLLAHLLRPAPPSPSSSSSPDIPLTTSPTA